MTADQRLDQLEPLVSQTLAVADRHTAQLKQIFGAINYLLEAGRVQSDDIQFVLREIVELKQGVGELKQDAGELKQGITGLNVVQQATNARLDSLETKLDRILGLLDAGK